MKYFLVFYMQHSARKLEATLLIRHVSSNCSVINPYMDCNEVNAGLIMALIRPNGECDVSRDPISCTRVMLAVLLLDYRLRR